VQKSSYRKLIITVILIDFLRLNFFFHLKLVLKNRKIIIKNVIGEVMSDFQIDIFIHKII